jgi:hypothetical protein
VEVFGKLMRQNVSPRRFLRGKLIKLENLSIHARGVKGGRPFSALFGYPAEVAYQGFLAIPGKAKY